MKAMVVLFVVFLVIGVVCLALGVNDYIHQEAWFAQAAQGNGTVTAYDLHVRNDGESEFCPRIEFTTKAGEPASTYGDICPSQPDKSQIVFFPFTGSLSLLLTFWQNRRAAAKAAKWQQPDATGANAILLQDAEKYHANQRATELRRLQEENAELKRKI